MGKLYVFMGKSASGKDTLYRELMRRHDSLRAVIPYTTRPIRAGETDGVAYHFVTEETMRAMEEKGQVLECRRYDTVKGAWYYFTAEDGQIDFQKGDFVLISTLEGYEKILRYYGADSVVPLYVEVDDVLRMERSLMREKQQEHPCVAEMCRRFLADEKDFSEEKLEQLHVHVRIQNRDLQDALRQIEEIVFDAGHE